MALQAGRTCLVQLLPDPFYPRDLSEARPWCPGFVRWVQGYLLQGCCEDELSNVVKVLT